MKKQKTFEELADLQRQEELKKFIIPEEQLAELDEVGDAKPEKIQRRSGWVRSSWGWKS